MCFKILSEKDLKNIYEKEHIWENILKEIKNLNKRIENLEKDFVLHKHN